MAGSLKGLGQPLPPGLARSLQLREEERALCLHVPQGQRGVTPPASAPAESSPVCHRWPRSAPAGRHLAFWRQPSKINPNRKAWGEVNSFHLSVGSLRARQQQAEPPASLPAQPHRGGEALLGEQTPGERGYHTVSTRAGGGTKPSALQQRPARARCQNSSCRAKPRRPPPALLPHGSPLKAWRVLSSFWGVAPHPDGCAQVLTLNRQCLFPALLHGAAHLSASPQGRQRKPRAAPGKEVKSPV